MARVQLKGVAKRWGNTTAVQPMDLDIADGEFLVLLGPSGCGKTTTMRMVAGLEDPSSGDVFIGERRVNDLEPKDRDVAMVFQSYGLYPNMTVRENIAFPLKIRGRSVDQIDPAVQQAASRVELLDFMDRKPKELSGGQRQRVALARAIVRQPAVFLMDEPLSNLDAKLRVSMRAHLKHLHHELGVTTLYVTHDQIEAMTLADRVVVMSKAQIQQVGSPEAIYNDPANLFVAGFIGSSPINLIEGELQAGRFVAPGLGIGGFGTLTRSGVVLGVRPEDLALADGSAGEIEGTVFSVELTGEATQVTLRAGKHLVVARTPKDFRVAINTPLALSTQAVRCFLFDAASTLRIRVGA
jgi:multiple sugar transport system ATP-binding protein